MDASLRKEAEAVFKEIGVDATTAVRMFYSKVVRTKSIPFDLNLNQEKGKPKELESLLLEAIDSPGAPFEANWVDEMKKRVRGRLAAKKKAKARA